MASSTAKIAPVFTAAAAASSSDPLVTELRKENAALKSENASLKKEIAALTKKRKGTDTAISEQPSKKAKTPAQRKKLFEKWSKALTRESAKSKLTNAFGWGNESYSVQIKETTPWTVSDFSSVFGGTGTKIQPTKDNKPTSTITIIEFDDMESIKSLFGEASIEETGYTVSHWRSRNFSKSYKVGDLPSKISKLQIHFNKSKLTLMLQFHMDTMPEDY